MSAVENPLIQWSWVTSHIGVISTALIQHAELSGIAILVGFGISLPISLVTFRHRRLRGPVIGVSGLLYTIPSIALFAILQPITGFFSTLTAEIALVSYTLLILIRNTIAGLDAVPDDVREAAQALGYTQMAEMLKIDLPLALPAIFAGLRVATVTVVGLVTVTAFIGLGGLGQLIINGFNQGFNTPIVVALVLAIVMAGVGDLLFVAIERAVIRWVRPARDR